MSSIIDALKKSDNNRNNEHSANVNAIKFGQNPPAKNKKGFWLLVVVLLLIAIGAFAWTQGWHHDLIQYSKSWTSDSATHAIDSEPTKPTKAAVNQDKTAVLAEKTSANNQLTPPKQNDIKAKTAELKKQQSELNNSVEAITMDSTDPGTQIDTKTAALSNDTEITPLNANSTVNKPAQKTDPKTISDSDAKTKDSDAVVNVEKQAKEKKSLPASRQQDYLLLHQIDFAIRKNIPAVKINIHIYDPLPENRMVLINGERFNIGDNIEELVTIDDIVQEGVVLKFENVRFLIPK